jgi:hypothetical protein
MRGLGSVTMTSRKKTLSCPVCQKRLSPQGLNGHLRFVHGVESAEASKSVARAPRRSDHEPAISRLESRIDDIEGRFEGLLETLHHEAEERWSPSGMRRRLVALVAELAEVKRQRSGKDWDVLWSGSSEEGKQVLASLDDVQSAILREIAELRAKLGESDA